MKSNNDLILNFYNDNPQLFFIRESNENTPWLHKAYNPNEIHEPQTTDNNDTLSDITLSTPQLNSIPERGKFTSALKKIGLAAVGIAITASMIAKAWDLDIHPENYGTDLKKQVEEIIDVTPVDARKEVTEELAEEFSIVYDANVDENEVIYDILSHEGYEAFPYPDENQWSVGNGTRVSNKPQSFFKELSKKKVKKLREEWRNKKNQSTAALSKWVSSKYPNWRNDFYEKYKISAENRSKDSNNTGISEDTAYEAADKTFNEILYELQNTSYSFSKDDQFKYWHLAPKHVKKVLIDLYYNMGVNVLNKFTQFNKNLGFALANLDKDIVTEADVINAELGIQNAAKELLNNFDKNDKIKSKTAYAIQNNKRSKANFKILANTPIDRTEYKMIKKENKSLKTIYKHLFS
jgi:hypothetical protein